MKEVLSLIFILTTTILFSQTVTTTIDVGSVDNALYCMGTAGDVNGEYDCKGSSNFMDYPDGWLSEKVGGGPGTTFYNFNDPVPPGNIISDIEITLYNSNCNSEGYVSVQGANVMFMLTGTPCLGMFPCGSNNTVVSSSFPGGLSAANYNYGGINNFDLMLTPGVGTESICFTHADIMFTYAPAPSAIPTLSEWGLIILGVSLSIFGVVSIRQRVIQMS